MDPVLSEARRLRERLDRIAAWRQLMLEHPGGVLPIADFARMSGVTGGRVRALVRAGRLVMVRPFQRLGDDTPYLPVDQVAAMPSRLEEGRKLEAQPDPGGEGYASRDGRSIGRAEPRNPSLVVTRRPQYERDPVDKRGFEKKLLESRAKDAKPLPGWNVGRRVPR